MGTTDGSILLVDQPGTIDEIASRFTARLGGDQLLTATDVRSARELVRTEDVLCVVSDFEVPDDSGIEYLRGVELLEQVREIDDELPVVLFTETSHEDAADVAINAGATNYVTRCSSEASIDELARRVEQIVDKRRAERRAERQAHLNEVLRDVNETLVRASTREGIELGVCRQLTSGTNYAHAVFYTESNDGVEIRAESDGGATITTDILRPLVGTVSPGSVRAFDSMADAPDPLATFALEQAYESLLLIPVAHRADSLGVVALFATTDSAFTKTKQSVFSELGETIGYALSAVQTRTELARQNERLDEFARTVSHDLRNPLTIINGRLDLAEETGDPTHFEAIERATERMESLIDDMLRRAREADIEHERPVSLASIANRAWQQVETEDGRLVIEGDQTIAADPGRLQQLFENCFRNSIEHGIPADGDRVTVRVGTLETGFYVEDDGPGIPEDERSIIFEHGYSTHEEGTGYGLGIVSQIIDDHDWSIRATESDEGGARFEVTDVTVDPHGD